MIDTQMLELRSIKNIIRVKVIRIDDAFRPYFIMYHRHQCLFSDIRNHLCIDFSFAF